MRQVWVRKKTRRWHAVVAGAIAGGLAILFERSKGGRRTVIAQQLFVRCVHLCPFLSIISGKGQAEMMGILNEAAELVP